MEDIRIDHHPDHWKSTLLGEDFWKDAELFNQPVHDDIEAGEFVVCTITIPPFVVLVHNMQTAHNHSFRTRPTPLYQVSFQPRSRARPTSQHLRRSPVQETATPAPAATATGAIHAPSTIQHERCAEFQPYFAPLKPLRGIRETGSFSVSVSLALAFSKRCLGVSTVGLHPAFSVQYGQQQNCKR